MKLDNALAYVSEISMRKRGDGRAYAYPSGEGCGTAAVKPDQLSGFLG